MGAGYNLSTWIFEHWLNLSSKYDFNCSNRLLNVNAYGKYFQSILVTRKNPNVE